MDLEKREESFKRAFERLKEVVEKHGGRDFSKVRELCEIAGKTGGVLVKLIL